MKSSNIIVKASKGICFVVLFICLVSCIYAGFLYTGVAPLPITLLDYLGERETKALRNVILDSNSQLVDENSYNAATALYELIEREDEARFEGYSFSSVAELKRVVQCLCFEIINGGAPEIQYYYRDGAYHMQYKYGAEAAKQHREATEFIDELYSNIEEQVNSLATEAEKAEFIAKHIKNEVVKGYDWTYNNRTIYDFMKSEDRVGVCSVYTMLFDKLCEKAGISNCYIVVGMLKSNEEVLHCWNKLIFSDGTVRYYDVTSYFEDFDTYSSSLIGFDEEFYKTQFNYRELEYTESGYKVGITRVNIARTW